MKRLRLLFLLFLSGCASPSFLGGHSNYQSQGYAHEGTESPSTAMAPSSGNSGLKALGVALQGMGGAYQNQVHCQSRQIGQTVYTDCN